MVESASIQELIASLANEINHDYAGLEINLVCLSNSAIMFTADLVRMIKIPLRQHLLAFAVYPEASKSGEVRLTLDATEPL